MSNLLNLIGQQLSPMVVNQIGKSLGMNDGATRNVVSSALPVLLSALSGNAQSKNGASALLGALQKKHDGGVFNQLGDLIAKPEAGEGNGILRHLLGNKRAPIEETITQATGVNQQQTAKIMEILAPVVMGALGKEQRNNNYDANGLAKLLQQSQTQYTQEAPKEMGAVRRLLDADGDGKVADDVANIGMKLLGSFLRRR